MTEYQLAAMDRAGEHGEPIFRAPSVGCSGETVARCSCGYPQPCGFNVPVTLCRLYRPAAPVATGETS